MNNRHVWVLTALLLCATAYGRNQSESTNSQPIQTVEGCLSYTDHTYVITGGNSPRQFRIVAGDVDPLRGKLGHTVAVSGVVGKSNPEENATQPPNEGTTTGVTYNTIQAQSVKDIAPNCSYGGSEH